jgi:hypothetical protein
MQRFDKFLLSLLKTICGLDITEFPGCMLKRKSNGKKAKWILHRLRGLIEYDIQQEFSEIVKHSNDSIDAHGQQLCSKAEQMLQQLDAQVDPAIACSTMLKFFAGKLYIIFLGLSLCLQFIIYLHVCVPESF